MVDGFAARVTAGLQELAEIDGDPDAGDAVVLEVRPADGGGGWPGPRGLGPKPVPGGGRE
ncbi:hypothetical protein OOK27_33015 [Streptomyces canus]|uniref:hypothetical protein n=1 Tax=Streptomyces canus TaxID=58343 RepID=UPI0022573AE9|nr:hypothetical protein [Streptomyces canus]MCX5258901.1 hypothetical protein [Streptomyces canus]